MAASQPVLAKWTEAARDFAAWLGVTPARDLNIYVARHMKTEANADPSIMGHVSDKAVQVLPASKPDAEDAARFLANHLFEAYRKDARRFGNVLVLYSPFDRTQDTAMPYIYHLGQKFGADSGRVAYRQDDRLIELQTGLRGGLPQKEYAARYPDAQADYDRHRKDNAEAYARSPLGESYMDLSWRVRGTHAVILNEYARRNVRHCVIVAHGGTNRAFVQGLMNYTPQWMIAEQNPDNNWIRHLRGTPRSGLVADPADFADQGYVHGKDAPLRDPATTQTRMDHADKSFVFTPQRPNDVVPPGMRVFNPLKAPRRP